MTSNGEPPLPANEVPVWYANKVQEEIDRHATYFKRQLRWYRLSSLIVIVVGAIIAVTAAVPAIPRIVFGVLGAVTAITQAVQDLYQFRKSSLNAMKTANSLERALNKYQTSTGPYAGPVDTVFPQFVRDVEAIRESADQAFLETWQHAVPPQAVPVGDLEPKSIAAPKVEGR